MTKARKHLRRVALLVLAVVIGAIFPLSEQIIFAAALKRPMDLSEPDVLVMNAVLVAIPFLLLATRYSARALPWLLTFAVTAWLHWWWLSKGIAYQKAPDGSGVDMFGALIMLFSPLPLGLFAMITDGISKRRSSISQPP